MPLLPGFALGTSTVALAASRPSHRRVSGFPETYDPSRLRGRLRTGVPAARPRPGRPRVARRPRLLRDFLAGLVSVSVTLVLLLGGYVLFPAFEAWIGQVRGTGSNGPPVFVPAPLAELDEQQVLALTYAADNLSFVVTALAQSDNSGYGPAYTVNGVTTAGYWYQVGIAYNWVALNLAGYLRGFFFFYQVWGPNWWLVANKDVPASVHSGDAVTLSLVFSGDNVTMQVSDAATSSTFRGNFSSEGAARFSGISALGEFIPYFSGPMTEWYHAGPDSGPEQTVSYAAVSPFAGPLLLGVDEGNLTNNASVFNASETVQPGSGCSLPLISHDAVERVCGSAFTTGRVPT